MAGQPTLQHEPRCTQRARKLPRSGQSLPSACVRSHLRARGVVIAKGFLHSAAQTPAHASLRQSTFCCNKALRHVHRDLASSPFPLTMLRTSSFPCVRSVPLNVVQIKLFRVETLNFPRSHTDVFYSADSSESSDAAKDADGTAYVARPGTHFKSHGLAREPMSIIVTSDKELETLNTGPRHSSNAAVRVVGLLRHTACTPLRPRVCGCMCVRRAGCS